MNMRDVTTETNKVQTGQSAAVRSHQAARYDLLGPEFIRRAAIRKTVGAKKYGSVQWRQGLNDVDYMIDAVNHLFDHLLKFMESGNEEDDNLGAIAWALDALMECERLHPEVFDQIYGACQLSGAAAADAHCEEMARRNGTGQSSQKVA